MKCLSVVGLRVRVQNGIRNVGPGPMGDRTLGHKATTTTLPVLHQSQCTEHTCSSSMEKQEGQGVRYIPSSLFFSLDCDSLTLKARDLRHHSLP